MKKPLLDIVHCVDTEGPLEEPLDATFERINKEFSLDLTPNIQVLEALQKKGVDLGGIENELAKFIAPERLKYLSLWADIEKMIRKITSKQFRFNYKDKLGNPYCYTWLVIDVVGYIDNPRRKPLGFHVVWDSYQNFLKDNLFNDALGWHFHTVPVGGHALHYNTCWTNNDWHEQSIAHRLIERGFFPSVFRAGGVVERNDLNFWLEQFIPFDYSNRSLHHDKSQPGSQTDWRGASTDWKAYNPCFYDYRKKGKMNRSIFRCLDVKTAASVLTEEEVEKAFKTVDEGQHAVLSYTNHDRRDMSPDIDTAYSLIQDIANRYPNVNWRFSNAHDAAREHLGIKKDLKPSFIASWEKDRLFIKSDISIFGPQPFLAIEEEGGVFYRDNFTQEENNLWAYWSPRWKKIKNISVAASSKSGEVGIISVAQRKHC